MCLLASAPYYKLNIGFFLSFLFNPLGGLRPPHGLNKKPRKSILYLLIVHKCLAFIKYNIHVCHVVLWMIDLMNFHGQ